MWLLSPIKRWDGSKETLKIPDVRDTNQDGDRRVEADFHDGSNEHHQNIDESETSHAHVGHPQIREAQRHEPSEAIHSPHPAPAKSTNWE
jgi:hypothetical protein